MKLSIGQVSKLFNISKDTLRYYDKIGILTPEVNPNNSYRYYLLKHLEKLRLILGIKYLGISLSDIRNTIKSEDIHNYKSLVIKQEDLVNKKIKELTELKKVLNNSEKILNTIIDFKNEYDFTKLKIINTNYNLYGIDIENILNSNLDKKDSMKLVKELNTLDENIYVYIYTIFKNEYIKEDENLVFLKETSKNLNSLIKYLTKNNIRFISKNLKGKFVSVDFYGTTEEIKDYIISLNKHFKCAENNVAYIIYKFYLPRKDKNILYFININLKI